MLLARMVSCSTLPYKSFDIYNVQPNTQYSVAAILGIAKFGGERCNEHTIAEKPVD